MPEKITLAVVNEKLENHMRNDEEHFDRSEQSQEKMLGYLKPMYDAFMKNSDMAEQHKTLWDERNTNRGIFATSKIFAAGIWTVIGGVMAWFMDIKR